MIRLIEGLIGNLFCWTVIGVVALMILAVALIFSGGACWIAFSIWKAVFSFFM